LTESIPYLGETIALATAFIWAIAVILFKKSGETVHPIGLNLFKDVLAVILLLPTAWLFHETLNPAVPASDYWLLLFSGALGIGVSDTFFFMCLNRIGAGLTAIVDCFYSPSIIGLSILWLGESLSFWQIIGTVLIISAILTATHHQGNHSIKKRDLILGIIFGILAMVTVAISIVSVKPLLERSSLIWVSEIRLIGGVIILLLVLTFHPARRKIVSSVISIRSWGYTLSGSFVGAYIALVFWLGGMKYTQASEAAALNQTSSIFIFLLAAIFLKEAITLRRIIGIMLAVSGAFMVMFG
jgi:drug/metabolite transporter (DMT)-like permease